MKFLLPEVQPQEDGYQTSLSTDYKSQFEGMEAEFTAMKTEFAAMSSEIRAMNASVTAMKAMKHQHDSIYRWPH